MAKAKKSDTVYAVSVVAPEVVTLEGTTEVKEGALEIVSKKFRSKKYIRSQIPMSKVVSYAEGEEGFVSYRADASEIQTYEGTVEHLDNGFLTVTDEEGNVTMVAASAVGSIEVEEDGEAAEKPAKSAKKADKAAPKKGGKKAKVEEEEEDEEEEEEEEEEAPKKKGGKKAAPAKKGGKKAKVEEEEEEEEDEEDEEEEDEDEEGWDE